MNRYIDEMMIGVWLNTSHSPTPYSVNSYCKQTLKKSAKSVDYEITKQKKNEFCVLYVTGKHFVLELYSSELCVLLYEHLQYSEDREGCGDGLPSWQSPKAS